MASSKKTEKLAEKVIQHEKAKVESVHDIEDIIKGTKSSYFSPIQTRNQRILKSSGIKPIPSLVNETVLQPVPQEIPKKKTRNSKKATEMKVILDNLKNLPNDDGPLQIVQKTTITQSELQSVNEKQSLSLVKEVPEVLVTKKKRKESPKSLKNKAILDDFKEIPIKENSLEVLQKKQLSPVAGKAKRKSKDSPKLSEIKLEKWEPSKWSEILENIKLMRTNVDAPVDTMGCHKCSDENADEKTQRFHILVALMLSSQTKDQVTYDAMKRLKGNSCTPSIIADMDSQKLETLLYPVSFYKNKAKYLRNTSAILVEQYDSDIPNNFKELIKLPGVGPKMAHLCMSSAWDIVTGIGVDVHVHRISNRLGWVRKETKEPEQTRKDLESWLPSDRWREVNHLLVGFGQTICTPTKPKCHECLNNLICPSAHIKIEKLKLKKEKVVLEV